MQQYRAMGRKDVSFQKYLFLNKQIGVCVILRQIQKLYLKLINKILSGESSGGLSTPLTPLHLVVKSKKATRRITRMSISVRSKSTITQVTASINHASAELCVVCSRSTHLVSLSYKGARFLGQLTARLLLRIIGVL